MIGSRTATAPDRRADRCAPPTPRRAGGAAALLLAALGMSGCYSYTPLRDPEPQLGQAFAFDLNQPCPQAVADRVGPDIRRVEGTLVRRTDTEFVVSVARTNAAGGRTYRWNGESVALPQAYVWQVRTKHFSPTRTVVAVGGAALSFVAFVVSRSLGVFGGGSDNAGGDTRDNGAQQ